MTKRLNEPSQLGPTFAAAGTTSPEDGYLFDDSGLPIDVKYLGKLSVSAAANAAAIVAADPYTLQYGTVPLSSIATALGFSIPAGTTVFTVDGSATSTASGVAVAGGVNTISFGIRETGGASALIFFVQSTGGATLSGAVILGKVI